MATDILSRRFTMDKQHIYFINNGIITRKNFLDFINEYDAVYTTLQSTKENVGWNTAGTALMFTEEDKVLRISDDIMIQMMQSSGTLGVPNKEPGIFALKYFERDWRDEDIVIKYDYKDFQRCNTSLYHLSRVPDISDSEDVAKCILTHDPMYIYFIDGFKVSKQHIVDYIVDNGENWRQKLAATDEHTGYTYDDRNYILRLTKDKIERIDPGVYERLITHENTSIAVRQSSLHDYIITEYNNQIFTDEVLGATSDYK